MYDAPPPAPTDTTAPENAEDAENAEDSTLWLRSTLERWGKFVTPAIAVIAVVLAIVGWFRPPSPSSITYSDDQAKDAKEHVCTAYRAVHRSVLTNTHRANPVPDNPIGALAVATNARLALYEGGGYLRHRLMTEPATPADLKTAIDSMANTLEALSTGYLAGLDQSLQPLRKELDSQIGEVDALCQ